MDGQRMIQVMNIGGLRLALSLHLGIGHCRAFTHTWTATAAEEETLLASSAHFLEKACIDPVCDLRGGCHREVAMRLRLLRSRTWLGKGDSGKIVTNQRVHTGNEVVFRKLICHAHHCISTMHDLACPPSRITARATLFSRRNSISWRFDVMGPSVSWYSDGARASRLVQRKMHAARLSCHWAIFDMTF